jgi:CTP:molybdopterin cytidylyltransferase MocA
MKPDAAAQPTVPAETMSTHTRESDAVTRPTEAEKNGVLLCANDQPTVSAEEVSRKSTDATARPAEVEISGGGGKGQPNGMPATKSEAALRSSIKGKTKRTIC